MHTDQPEEPVEIPHGRYLWIEIPHERVPKERSLVPEIRRMNVGRVFNQQASVADTEISFGGPS